MIVQVNMSSSLVVTYVMARCTYETRKRDSPLPPKVVPSTLMTVYECAQRRGETKQRPASVKLWSKGDIFTGSVQFICESLLFRVGS